MTWDDDKELWAAANMLQEVLNAQAEGRGIKLETYLDARAWLVRFNRTHRIIQGLPDYWTNHS